MIFSGRGFGLEDAITGSIMVKFFSNKYRRNHRLMHNSILQCGFCISITRRGVSLYEDYPLHPLRMQGECLVKSSNRKIYIAGYNELPCNADAETTLKNTVMHQPVIATIFVGEELDHYRAGDGIFQTEASSGENHAVLVIGFGELVLPTPRLKPWHKPNKTLAI
ncbi:Papain family cysteine protease [Trifolium repens]|nr:Papain family cysteine protease [Trifolium repens]